MNECGTLLRYAWLDQLRSLELRWQRWHCGGDVSRWSMASLTVAYIGIATRTNTIRARLLAHVSNRSNWALGRLAEVAKLSIVFYPFDNDTAKAIESNVVSAEKPPFNVKPEYKHYVPSITVH